MSQKGLASQIISDFLPEDFPSATSPASLHLFNHVPDDKPNNRTKLLSIIMHIARLSRPDLHATAYLATKAQHYKESDHKDALRIIIIIIPT